MSQLRLPRVGVPIDLIADPQTFGGQRCGDLLCGTLLLVNGHACQLEADTEPGMPRRLVLPRLTEAHVHLEKAFTVERIPSIGGDLEAAVAAQFKDKSLWTRADLAQRITRGIDELRAAGVGVVRSHVDWGCGADDPEAPLAWEVLTDLASAGADGLTLQAAALTGIDEMAEPANAQSVARRVARDGGVLGSFVKYHPDRRAGLKNLFDRALHHGLSLDFHVDEGLDPSLDGVELIADVALQTGFDGPILCGHACALMSLPEGDVARIADKLARAGITIAILPTTNLYLQGRIPGGTPTKRGLTCLHELRARGVEIVVGSDNVQDAFCPIGRHDPLYSLSVAVLAGHLDPPFAPHIAMITSAADRALGLPSRRVDGARAEDLLVYDAAGLAGLIAAAPSPTPLPTILETADAG
ncbi:MAG: amidohydrolase [Pseudomonadota bacterium]